MLVYGWWKQGALYFDEPLFLGQSEKKRERERERARARARQETETETETGDRNRERGRAAVLQSCSRALEPCMDASMCVGAGADAVTNE